MGRSHGERKGEDGSVSGKITMDTSGNDYGDELQENDRVVIWDLAFPLTRIAGMALALGGVMCDA